MIRFFQLVLHIHLYAVLSTVTGFAQDTYRAPNGFVITPQANIRAAEGELLLFCGEDKRQISPYAFLPLASGGIKYATVHDGVQYQFELSPPARLGSATADEQIFASTITISAGNITQAARDAAVWSAWLNASPDKQDYKPGILLANQSPKDVLSLPYELKWNKKWTWMFHNDGLLRGEQIIYWPANHEEWNRKYWVRRLEETYHPLTPNTPMGIQKFNITLDSGNRASIKFCLPYTPVNISVFDRVTKKNQSQDN